MVSKVDQLGGYMSGESWISNHCQLDKTVQGRRQVGGTGTLGGQV